jgi:hypothetical protein
MEKYRLGKLARKAEAEQGRISQWKQNKIVEEAMKECLMIDTAMALGDGSDES